MLAQQRLSVKSRVNVAAIRAKPCFARPMRAPVAVRAMSQGLSPELRSRLDKIVKDNKVVLFMKGTKQIPLCGFSNNVVQILNAFKVPFEHVNILDDEDIRQGMKEYSQWPTFPQLYVNGEFVGGADILVQMYQSNELQAFFEKELAK